MSANTLVELQKAIFTTCAADTYLNTLVAYIGDDIPQDTPFPYLVIGDDQEVGDWGASDITGHEITITFHTYDRPKDQTRSAGRMHTKEIFNRLQELFHKQPLSVSNNNVVCLHKDGSSTFLEDDGRTRRGVMRFRTLMTE